MSRIGMGPLGVLYFFIRLIILLLLSNLIDHLLARSMSQWWYRAFRWFGVAIHELSHAFACLLTGTRISEINLFHEGGGYVKHEKRGPFVTAVISMAPAIGGPLVIALFALLFSLMGVFYPMNPPTFEGPLELFTTWGRGIYDIFAVNIGSLDPLVITGFIIFLMLMMSLVSTLSPSTTDLKNGILGLILLGLIAAAAAFVQVWKYVPPVYDHFHSGTPALDAVVRWVGAGVDMGIFASIVILIIVVPIYLVKRSRKKG